MSALEDDIVTDAVADAPRPRGTRIPDPSVPSCETSTDDPTLSDEEKQSTFSQKKNKSGCGTKKASFGGKRPTASVCTTINVCNSAGVHIGPTVHINATDSRKRQPEQADLSRSQYKVLLTSKKEASDIHFERVASNIGGKWELLGERLDFKDVDLYRLQSDYRDDHVEKVTQLLQEWRRNIGGPDQAALLSHLSEALWQSGAKHALDSLLELEKDPRFNAK